MGDVKNVLASFWGVVWNERRTTSLTHHIIGALNISKHKEQYYINIQAMDKSIGDDGERPSLARHYQMLHELFEKFGLSSSLFGSPHRPILQFLTACNSRSSLDTFTTNFLPPSFFFCVCIILWLLTASGMSGSITLIGGDYCGTSVLSFQTRSPIGCCSSPFATPRCGWALPRCWSVWPNQLEYS